MTNNGKPVSDVSIKLVGAKTTSTTTDANGYYTFRGLRAGGSYTINPARSKINFTPPSRSIKNLVQDGSADFSGLVQANVYKISGRVMDAAKPLSGISIMIKGAKTTSTTTDANGNYTFRDLPEGGSYTITPATAKMNFTPPRRSINNLRKDESADFSAPVKHDQTTTPECTVVDEGRERKIILGSYADIWRQRIERAPPKTRIVGLPPGHEKADLGPIEYQITFQGCGALITAKYVWEVTRARLSARIPGAEKFHCVKVVGAWVCH